MMEFRKATKAQAKARIALDGPSGSGKTFTALTAASALGGRIAVIDTERGSASLYADRFAFDTLDLETFAPATYVKAIRAAETAGYHVIVIDSLSHAWSGRGGALEMVDQERARSRGGNSFVAWRKITPEHNALVDAMLQSPCHIVATMRTKTEYVMETNEKGKQVPRKIGMAPVQRDGMEYEFTIVGDMDLDHTMVVSKSRMADIADAVVKKPDEAFFAKIKAWLSDGAEERERCPSREQAEDGESDPEPQKASDDMMRALGKAARAAGMDERKYRSWLTAQCGHSRRPTEAEAKKCLQELQALARKGA